MSTTLEPPPARGRSLERIRVAGVLALVLLVAFAVSDLFFGEDWWETHALTTSIVANCLVLMVAVAVVNEFLEARAVKRWRIVAYWALTEFGITSRRVWLTLAEELGLPATSRPHVSEVTAQILSDEGRRRLAQLAAAAAADPSRRPALRRITDGLSDTTRHTLTSWAPIMVHRGTYSEAVGRFTELHGRLKRLDMVLEEELSGRAISMRQVGDQQWIGQRLCKLIEHGIELEKEFTDTAYRLVPREWWERTNSSSAGDLVGMEGAAVEDRPPELVA